MQRQRQRDTQPEVALRSCLHRRGLRFRVNYPLAGIARRSADIAFPRRKLAIFIDGCFWHGCPEHGTYPKQNAAWWQQKIGENRKRDKDTDARLAAAGWSAVRVWEHEHPYECADRIVARLREL
jgi:DNA mismatch endonuclease (patch repair protein)